MLRLAAILMAVMVPLSASAAPSSDRWLYDLAARGQSAAALYSSCREIDNNLLDHCRTVIVSVLSLHHAMSSERPEVAMFCLRNPTIEQARLAFVRWYGRVGLSTQANVDPAVMMPGAVAVLSALHHEFPCFR